MDLVNFTGIIGSLLILVAFIFVKYIKKDPKNIVFNFLNSIGSAFLIIYSININSLIFVFLNTIWLIASLSDIFRYIQNYARKKNFSK